MAAWPPTWIVQVDDTTPPRELHCVYELAGGVPPRFVVRGSEATMALLAAVPYPIVAVPSHAVEGRQRPGIAFGESDFPTETHDDGTSFNTLIAVAASQVEVYRAAEMAGNNGDERGRVLLVIPEGWEAGGIRWKRQAILMAGVALTAEFDRRGAGRDHPYRGKVVQIDDDITRVGAVVATNEPLDEVPMFILLAYLEAPFAASSELVMTAPMRIAHLRRWGSATAVEASSNWRSTLRCEQVFMLDLIRLLALADPSPPSFLEPEMLSWSPEEIRRQCELYAAESPDGRANLTKHEDFDLCVRLGKERCAVVGGLYTEELGNQASAVDGGNKKSAKTKQVYSNANVQRIREFVRAETPPEFDAEHYPKGVNNNFYTMTAAELDAKFGGNAGLFHSESRDIAKQKGSIAAEAIKLVSTDQQEPIAILELGCGTGVISEALIRQLAETGRPKWQLISTEVSPGFVEIASTRLEKLDATLVEPSHGQVTVLHHPPHCLPGVQTNSCDACAIIDVYHHLEYPKTLLRDIRRTLKPGAKLLLIDFHRDKEKHQGHPEDPEWMMKHVRGDQSIFEAEIVSCGFVKVGELTIEGIHENYCVVFQSTRAVPTPTPNY